MKHLFDHSYETVGNSEFLVIALKPEAEFHENLIQMLSGNSIPNMLRVEKRRKNDSVQLFYDITSKIPLSRVTSREKISREGLLKLMAGIVGVQRELVEYLLPGAGVLFDAEYIFVDENSFEPFFVYVPIARGSISAEEAVGFIRDLIARSKIEMTKDNFVQTVLDTLNTPGLKFDDLEDLTKKIKNASPLRNDSHVTELRQNAEEKTSAYAPRTESAPVPPAPVPPVQPTPVRKPEAPQVPTHSAEKPAGKFPFQKNKKTDVAKEPSAGTTDGEKNKKADLNKFKLMQLAFLAIVMAASLSGLLQNENGEIRFNYLLGLLLVLGAADFIIYREMFINKKGKGQEKQGTKQKPEKKNKGEKSSVSSGKLPGIRIPGKASNADADDPGMTGGSEVDAPKSPQNAAHAFESSKTVDLIGYTNAGGEDRTVFLNENRPAEPRLEYSADGALRTVSLVRPTTLIGKTAGGADCTIDNKKISRRHAAFINREGSFFVKDLGSTNGTFINGGAQRLETDREYPIYAEDVIKLADTEFIFKY